MKVHTRIKHHTQKEVVKTILNKLPDYSAENLIRLAWFIESITPTKEPRKVLRTMRQHFEKGHSHLIYIQKILGKLHPKCRDKLAVNLIVNGLLINQGKREKILEDEGIYIPISVLISPTMRCNLSCEGCYASAYGRQDDMDFETADKIICEAKELGVALFTILGGEPLIWKDLFKLFETHNDCYFQVYTNGTMVDQDTVKRLTQVGNATLQLSLEGYEGETDNRRGKGTYEKLMRSMDLLREGGVLFGYSVDVTRRNVEVVTSDQFVDLMINKGAYIGWYFLCMPVGRQPDPDLMPTAEQRNHLRLAINRLRYTKPLFFVDFFNDAPYTAGCISAGRGFLHINSKGDLEPCIFCHFATDNLKEKGLKEALNSPYFRAIWKRQPFNKNMYLPCMLIDNPQVFREIFDEIHPYPTHKGAESLVTDPILMKKIDEYSEGLKHYYIKAWKENSKEFTFPIAWGEKLRQMQKGSASNRGPRANFQKK